MLTAVGNTVLVLQIGSLREYMLGTAVYMIMNLCTAVNNVMLLARSYVTRTLFTDCTDAVTDTTLSQSIYHPKNSAHYALLSMLHLMESLTC